MPRVCQEWFECKHNRELNIRAVNNATLEVRSVNLVRVYRIKRIKRRSVFDLVDLILNS